jgi:hypothetical protein
VTPRSESFPSIHPTEFGKGAGWQVARGGTCTTIQNTGWASGQDMENDGENSATPKFGLDPVWSENWI